MFPNVGEKKFEQIHIKKMFPLFFQTFFYDEKNFLSILIP